MPLSAVLRGSEEYRAANAEARAAAARARALRPWYRKLPYQPLFALGLLYLVTFDPTGRALAGQAVARLTAVAAPSDAIPAAPAPSVGSNAPATNAGNGARPAAAADRLALLSATCVEQRGSNRCSGAVRNVTDRPMPAVEVVITWLDAAGAVGRTDATALPDPIPAGQQATWELTAPSDRALNSYRISFRDPAGPLPTRDDR